jgi:hypothetical protein
MSNNAENEGGSIQGDNITSNTGGSIFGDNNASNEGGSIGEHHKHDPDGGGGDGGGGGHKHGEPVAGFAALLPTDGVTLAFPVHHGLETRDTISMLYNPITGVQYLPGIVAGDYTTIHTSDDVTTFVFVAPAPLPGTVRAVIVGVQ